MWNASFLTTEALAGKKTLVEALPGRGHRSRASSCSRISARSISPAGGHGTAAGSIHFLTGEPSQVAAESQPSWILGMQSLAVLRFTNFPSTVGLERFTTTILPALALA